MITGELEILLEMEQKGQVPVGTADAVKNRRHDEVTEIIKNHKSVLVPESAYTHSDEETRKDARVRAIIERYEQQVRDLQKGWGSHIHDFQYCLNANHTAIRGCTTCGYTCGTLVQGNDPRQLEWHPIREPEEQEEEEEGE